MTNDENELFLQDCPICGWQPKLDRTRSGAWTLSCNGVIEDTVDHSIILESDDKEALIELWNEMSN